MASIRTTSADHGLALFARDFDDPMSRNGVIVLDEPDVPVSPPEPEPPAITQADLAASAAAAHAAGLRQGRAEAAAASEAEQVAMTARLLDGLRDADTMLRETVEAAGAQISALVLSTLDACFPDLCARHGAAEMARFTREITTLLGQEPRIVIRINPAQQPALDAVLSDLEPERRGAILVEPRDALPPGDARIAWQHGLASRDTAALRRRISDILGPLGLAPIGGDALPVLLHD